jgi:predicted ATP-grasp superfamily ATP-dependent carboligase
VSAGARPHVLLLAEDDDFAYRVLSAAVSAGARISVLARNRGLDLHHSRFVERVDAAEHAFDPGSPGEAASMIDAFARACGADLVIPTNAGTTRFLCAAGARLQAAPFLPVPPLEVFDTLNDKGRFAALLARLRVPAPRTIRFETAAELRAAIGRGEIAEPGVIKPVSASGGNGVWRLTPGEHAPVLDAIDYAPVLWQPFVAGPTWHASALCLNGRMHGLILYSLVRGVFTFFRHEGVQAAATRIVAATHYSGLINLDLIAPQSGPPVWLECNPRPFFTIDMHAAAGVDFLAPALAGDACAREVALIRLERQACEAAGRQLRDLRAQVVALATGASLTSQDVRLAARQLADPVFLAKDRLRILRRKLTAWNRSPAIGALQPVPRPAIREIWDVAHRRATPAH